MTFILKVTENLELKPSQEAKIAYQSFLENNVGKHLKIEKEVLTRTGQQNKALHVFFEMVAKELNDSGQTIQMALKERVELDWTGILVKELYWRRLQIHLFGKESTTKLKKQEEIDSIYDHMNRHLGEKFGIHVEFPNDPDRDKAPLLTDTRPWNR